MFFTLHGTTYNTDQNISAVKDFRDRVNPPGAMDVQTIRWDDLAPILIGAGMLRNTESLLRVEVDRTGIKIIT
jgi:hypothetical protein